jgi:hypothetical protein
MANSALTDGLPTEGYVVEIGGQFNCEYGTFTGALKAGLELKSKDSHAEVRVYDASERAASSSSGNSQ